MIDYLNRHTGGGYEIESAFGRNRIVKKDSHGGINVMSDWMTKIELAKVITAINNIIKEETGE